MQELIDAGYVYIAKPPLYKVKQGSHDKYVEKESELEELLLADKYEKLDITDRDGKAFSVTETRWLQFRKLLRRYESLATAMRGRFGNDMIRFVEESNLLGAAVANVQDAVEVLGRSDHEGEYLHSTLLAQDDEVLTIRTVERLTGLAATHRVPLDLFDAPEYRSFLKVHQDLVKLAGDPPFTIGLGDRTDTAASFDALRTAVLGVASKGVTMNRFKGLGEMNPEQLRETTMDPATRTLQKVTIEDATAADQIFSMLMGDVVEPRRNFIEDNARDVVNLDV
jgi:DNA gyrase subunit B